MDINEKELILCGPAIQDLLNHTIKKILDIDNCFKISESEKDAHMIFDYKGEKYRLYMVCEDENYNMFLNDPLLIARDEDYYSELVSHIEIFMEFFIIAYTYIINNTLNSKIADELDKYKCQIGVNKCHNIKIFNYDNYKIISFKVIKD